jgi:preflagellin peptidase FlaK
MATTPDLLRLLTIPFFAYVAWRDIETRRVPNKTWIPLALLAIALLVWELAIAVTGGMRPGAAQQYYIQTAVSIGFLIPLSYLFWRIGGFGGADAKAFFIIAALFPTFPTYEVWRLGLDGLLTPLPGVSSSATLPAVETTLGVFSVTILSNTVILGALYPFGLALRNAVTGRFSPGMFVGRPVRWDETTDEYGTLLSFPERRFFDDLSLSGIVEYSNWRGVDLDALRMYLQWRGLSLADLRENPERYRNPASLSAEQNAPGDGAITDGGDPRETPDDDTDDGEATEDAEDREAQAKASPTNSPTGETVEPWSPEAFIDEALGDERPDQSVQDPWGAEAFLDDIDGSAYGTTPETLRNSLDTLTTEETVWISPGIPFLVPLFIGVVSALTYGDVLFAALDSLGLAA